MFINRNKHYEDIQVVTTNVNHQYVNINKTIKDSITIQDIYFQWNLRDHLFNGIHYTVTTASAT